VNRAYAATATITPANKPNFACCFMCVSIILKMA
jgi:hypothetical protein